MLAVVVNAIKELFAWNTEQDGRLEGQEQRIRSLEAEVARLNASSGQGGYAPPSDAAGNQPPEAGTSTAGIEDAEPEPPDAPDDAAASSSPMAADEAAAETEGE